MTPFVQESIGMAGFVTNVAGNMLLTRKNKHGWWIRILSNFLWTAYAGVTASLSMNVNHGVFFFINIYGWWKWRAVLVADAGRKDRLRLFWRRADSTERSYGHG